VTIETQDQQLTTCDIDTGNGRITMYAEATETPGLYVTPDLANGHFVGTFAITHGPSGLRIPVGWDGDDLDQVRAIADALGKTPVDWTADREAVAAQIAEHIDAITAARRDAKYPRVEAEDVRELGAYPLNEEQATADTIAKHLTSGLRYRTRDTWTLIDRDDKDGRAIYMNHAAALVAEWAIVYALREFAKVDQQVADSIARDIWNAWEDGGSVHELAWDWAREYGLPQLPDKDETETPVETLAVVTITPSEVL
jgi:hypothetical protein